MQKSFLFILVLSTFICKGQTGKLRLNINSNVTEDSTCYTLVIFSQGDTICRESGCTEYENEFDSLEPGLYKIHLYDAANRNEPAVAKTCTVHANELTKVFLDISMVETTSKIDVKTREETVRNRQEVAFNFSYFKNSWADPHPAIRFGAAIGITGYNWFAFSRHVGILTGFGFGYGHYAISKDTTFINFNQQKKTYEYYNYLDAHGDFKFRFTLGNQQTNRNFFPKAILDIGVIYNLPVVFDHIARYDNDKKVSNYHLHQFTDVRTYVNFGFAPVLFFFEYRLTNFIIGNYPELSRYNTGIRLIIN